MVMPEFVGVLVKVLWIVASKKKELAVYGYTVITSAYEKGMRGIVMLIKYHLNATESWIVQTNEYQKLIVAEINLDSRSDY